MSHWGALAWPGRYWARQSLRARLTLVATALFSIAIATGVVLVLVLQRYALTRVLDTTARKAAVDIRRHQIVRGVVPPTVTPITGGVTAVQVLDPNNDVVGSSAGPNSDRTLSFLSSGQLDEARDGQRFTITNTTGLQLRVLAVRAGRFTVVVYTDISRVDDSIRVLTEAALIGAPIAVLLVGLSTYFVTSLTLRSVGALRHGAANISAAGLSGQRLPVPGAQDEIHRLAVTLNRMLDRIESATARQRTFVGDAAHELRSPLASLRVQLEVAQRMGPGTDWPELIDDVLIDVGRLDRLVGDLLALARLDETGDGAARHEPVELGELVESLAGGYDQARVPVAVDAAPGVSVLGDRDGLHRVVVNLVDNAQRYARTEVRIAVSANRSDATLTVIDDGPGLPEGERERVFDRFYRAELSRSRDSGGTGLGLPIVRDIVRAHHGSVHVDARSDGEPGLQATVALPLAPA
ncbi:MAG: sensor histidine kinase [Jatrophihabitantaceae bacterium]